MNQNKLIMLMVGVMAVLSFAAFGYATSERIEADQVPDALMSVQGAPTYSYDNAGLGGRLVYTGRVTVIKTEALTGKQIVLAEGKHNLIVNNGLNYSRWQIGNGSAVASSSMKYMALSSDATGVDATDVNLDAEITLNGFARAAGTYAANGTGKWNYTYEWTATGTQNAIQKIGMHYGNTANDNTLFAELTFTPDNYLINDKLLAVWSQEQVSS